MKNIKKILAFSVIVVTIIASLFLILKYTVEAANINVENGVAGLAIQKDIIKPYVFTPSSYKKISTFPIDRGVFNSDADYFCAQHGTPYGSSSRNTILGSGYHNPYTVTKHKTTYSSDPKGDVDTSADIYLDTNGVYTVKPKDYYGYRESTEIPDDTVYTNWIYFTKDLTFDCEPGFSSSEIEDGGISFLLACYKQTDAERASTGYNNDPLQFAVWDWLKQGAATNPLKAAALSYQQYHEASKEPNVDTTPANNVGTTTNSSMTNYVVGPFKMSAYIRAEDFSYDEVGTYQDTIVDGSLENDDGDRYDVNIDNKGVNLQSTIHKYDSSFDGTIIKAEAVVTNESGATKRISFPVPKPNEDYYINLSAAAIEGYDELLDVVFTYQRIHASGNGTLYEGKQEAVNFKQETTQQSSCRYYCQDGTSGCSTYKSPGSSSVPYSGTCIHTYYTGCYTTYDKSCSGCLCPGTHKYSCGGCKASGTDANGKTIYTCPGNHTRSCGGCYCHGTHPRHNHGTYNVYTHADPYKCNHGHEDCWYFDWTEPTHGGDYAQDGLAASGALSTERIEYKIRVSVPMKTNMSIYKYISNVEHVGEEVVTYSGSGRKNKTMSEKEQDSLKVEKGDKITYKVEIVNDSRFPTMVKVKDTLPEPCSDEDIPADILNSPWITVEPKSSKVYTITLRTNADSGSYTNTVEFITTNSTNPTMRYSIWDNDATHGPHTQGPIVNIGTREKDSDTFKLKEYSVGIQKYIYDVEHNPENIEVSNIDTTMGPSNGRKRGVMSETDKQNAPVYAEYGDIVTYQIIVYNTTDGIDEEFDVDRENEPYWEPDKVYVTIKDELPQKYKLHSLDISGAIGPGTGANTNYITSTESTSGGTLTIEDLMVPAGGIRVITLKLIVDEYRHLDENGEEIVEANTATLIGGIRNINRGPRNGSPAIDEYCLVKNNSNSTESSDYYKINDYDISLNKFIYKYDEAELDLNNSNGITDESSATATNNEILKPAGNTTENYTREVENESYKKIHPINVEQYEKLTYKIKAKNNAISSGSGTSKKHATQVRTTKVTDYMQEGLRLDKVTAKIYDSSGNIVKRYSSTGKVTVNGTSSPVGTATIDGVKCNKYEFTIGNETILNPGEYIEYEVIVTVTKSNMYLYSLLNKAELSILTNINNSDESSYIIKDETRNENIATQQSDSDYVRLKDLVISGYVWLDIDKDGLMSDGDRPASDLDKINYNINNEAMKKDIEVRLYKVDASDNATLIRKTKTDSDGLYTFARREGSNSWYGTFNHTVDYERDDPGVNGAKYQRVDKAEGKDEHGNYLPNSQYNKYYIEFAYDGVVYKSTEAYAGVSNLTQNDGRFNEKYPIDSNAAELEKEREAFNKKYEYISYDIAYDLNKNKANGADLEFQKAEHSSILIEDAQREMTSKSFILKYNKEEVLKACELAMNSCGASKWKSCTNHWDDWQVVIAMGIMDDSAYPNTTAGRNAAQAYLRGVYNTLLENSAESGNTQMIKYLWLYSFNNGVDPTIPETDYLKYINLGLELREDVDLSLSKDLYKIKTTINGEEMEYDYNLGETAEYLDKTNPYIVKKPYGFEVYESDYKYRIEQYMSKAVEEFKGNGADELNIEVTYRINLKNEITPDMEGGSINTPLDVKVHEVLDLYDQNFMDIGKSPITAMVKDDDGVLIPKQIETAEAWMFMTKSEASGKELLEDGKTYAIRSLSDKDPVGTKPTYVADADGDFVKVKLNVSGETEKYSIKKDNDFTADGYKTAYITGMGNLVISEGESIDIYVKYVLDKGEVEIDVDENYDNTKISTVKKFDRDTNTYIIEEKTNDNISKVLKNVSGGKGTLLKSIKLAEEITNTFKDTFGRGIENIAQINAYSVWYTDGDPASLVDKDSNAGNIGIKNISEGKSPKGSEYSETTTSADDEPYYEDMSFKTGVEIKVTTPPIIPPPENPPSDDPPPLIRRISGVVWDDSRSTTVGGESFDKETAQYIGNGMYNPGGDGKIDQAKSNDNVKINYKESGVTEDTDIAVRNVKAEFIEVININGKYYEEILTDVTWKQKQNVRTNENGEYELYGFIPGTYIVRFSYGDFDEKAADGSNKWEKLKVFDERVKALEEKTDLTEAQKNIERDAILTERNELLGGADLLELKDMLVFNGQDYKSTQYTGVDESLDSYKDADKIIVEFNDEKESDARDDEIRRLEVNSYSEVMTNERAEILKGLANGQNEITASSSKNYSYELEDLIKNTSMTADTREFLVKPEKLLDENDGVSEEENQKLAYENEYMYSDSTPFYKYFTSMRNEHIEERYFDIRNVDFGIEYRPESEISLMKEIVQLTLITEDNEILVDLHFETHNDGNNITHEINKEKSTGYDLVQFITNDYKPKSLINNIVSEEYVQGLAYVQVDEEVLQGCTVKITYGFNAQNCSEVDRISTNLNAIRYKYNEATQKLLEEYRSSLTGRKDFALIDINNISEQSKYISSALAKAVVLADAYNIDAEGILYREIPKTLTKDGKDGYYGRYVGNGYYTGDLSNLDTISSLKFDKILDYIDTNLEYEQKTTSEEVIDRLWSKITSRELVSLVSHYKGLRQTVGGMTDAQLPKVTDVNGIEYKSMVVSVDDRNVDPNDPNEKEERKISIKNKDLSRFLVPKVTAVGLNGNDDDGKQYDAEGKLGYDDYTGHIYLDVSKVLGAGSDEDDKTYENMAEIVQFTTLNGRRTNFATTIGNANIHDIKDRLDNNLPPFDDTSGKNSGSIEFITASIEPDTSATETITLIPPTGLMKNRRAIVSIMETAKTGVEVMSMTGLVVAMVAVIAFLVILATRKYKKRRIK